MNELTKFNFSGMGVRVAIVNDEPWWMAFDVCRVLSLTNVSEAMNRLDCDEKTTLRISEGGPEVNFVNESGLYTLIIRSTKPKAKAFRKWITSEVLPQIRKTGSYSLPVDDDHKILLLCEELTKKTLEAISLKKRIEANQSKVDLAEQCLIAENSQPMKNIAKEIGTGRNRLFEILREKKILMSDNTPYQPYLEQGWFEVKVKPIKMGLQTINKPQTYVTAKGLDKIRQLTN